MKVPASIRSIYVEQKERAERLKHRVDSLLKSRIDARWHYESRVKEIGEFYSKGRIGVGLRMLLRSRISLPVLSLCAT